MWKKYEMINHVVSECSKLAPSEYKSWHDWMGKVIYRELYKRLNFDHITKWYMHKAESVRENGSHKILWDFQIQTDHVISTRRPDFVIINKRKEKKRKKRTHRRVDFAFPEWK